MPVITVWYPGKVRAAGNRCRGFFSFHLLQIFPLLMQTNTKNQPTGKSPEYSIPALLLLGCALSSNGTATARSYRSNSRFIFNLLFWGFWGFCCHTQLAICGLQHVCATHWLVIIMWVGLFNPGVYIVLAIWEPRTKALPLHWPIAKEKMEFG